MFCLIRAGLRDLVAFVVVTVRPQTNTEESEGNNLTNIIQESTKIYV